MKNRISYSFPSLLLSKRTTLFLFIIYISGSMLISCKFSKEKEKIDDNSEETTALQVVENAIDAAGKMEKWKRIASLEYTKKSRLLLENNQIESEVTQRHHYVLRPNKSIKIAWVVDKDSFLIVHTDSISQKFKNGVLIDEGNKVKSSVNSALYVVGMPFKLLDKGTVLNYEGLKHLNTNDTVHVVKATYAPKEHQNHSTQDEWWYHFDKNNGAFLSSMVYHEPTYALIENLSVIEQEGLTFPGIRKSYRCDESGKKIFLRAEFWYEDYSVKFIE